MEKTNEARRDWLVDTMRKSCEVLHVGGSRTFRSRPVRMSLNDLQWLLLERPSLVASGCVWRYEWNRVIPGVYDVWPVGTVKQEG